MLGRTLLAALIGLSLAARADEKGEIDWSRRVIKARGQGAPDLNAPSISVARLGAERAAKADAMRNLLELLKGATVEGGGSVGALINGDKDLNTRVSGALRGFSVVKSAPGKPNPHYYSDGGVAIDVELPIDSLPEELRKGLHAPPPGAPGDSKVESAAFVIDALGLGSPSGEARLVDESGTEVQAQVMGVLHAIDEQRPNAAADATELRARAVKGQDVVLSAKDAARVRAVHSARVLFIY